MNATPPFTLDPLNADDPRFVERHPGVQEVERLFPSPVTSGKGSVAIEGGVSIVGGPGMGKTSLLAQLAARLDRDRRLTTATVPLPRVADFHGEQSFYPFLGQLVLRIRQALGQAPRLADPALAPVAAALQPEPVWDGPQAHTMTPRGFERFIGPLAQAAQRTPGVCLLFDDVDPVVSAPWKGPFISALRFVFQASTGITPIYSLWTLFGDESLPGSNYFRNVTRPLFLEPLPFDPAAPGSRFALIDRALPHLQPQTRVALARKVGGHPLLLHRLVGDLARRLPGEADQTGLAADAIDAALGPEIVAEQCALIADLLARSPGLPAALKELSRNPLPMTRVMRGVVASGLVDDDEQGGSQLPVRVRSVIFGA